MKIDKAGEYPTLSMEEYHADCCVGPSISASRLHTIIAECPAIFWETSILNPKRVEEKSTKSFDVGRAAHALCLGEPEFYRYFVISPYDDFRKKEAQEWRNAQTKTVLKSIEFDIVLAMADAQRRSPQVARAFVDGRPEISLIFQDKETGVWLKSRPDWLPDDPASRPLTQYKTCRSIEPRKLSLDAFAYGYHIGAALELDAVQAVFGVKPIGICHVVQDKSVPYLAELRMFDGDGIEFGRREYRRALRLFAKCWEKHLAGKPEREAWPGFTESPQYFDLPYYIRKQLENPENGPDGYSRTPTGYTSAEYFAAG